MQEVKRKPGRPKGSTKYAPKQKTQAQLFREEKARNRQFAFDWCWLNKVKLEGIMCDAFLFSCYEKPWELWEKGFNDDAEIKSYIPPTDTKQF